MAASLFLPGKKIATVKVVDPSLKIATGVTVGTFEASLFKLPQGERVAVVKEKIELLLNKAWLKTIS